MMRRYVFALLLLAGCSRAPGLMAGGDFEPVSEFEGVPTGWYATRAPETAGYVIFEWDREVAHSGERSISIAVAEDHPESPVAYNWTRVVDGWEVGGVYELEGWIRTDSLAESAWIVVQCWNLEREDLVGFATTQADFLLRGTHDWTRVGLVIEVPSGTGQLRIRAGIAAPDNRGGKVWFDDIAIRRVK